MLAVDTNLIVRLLTDNDTEQTPLSQSVFDFEEIWISKTVLLETHWVLLKGYGLTKREIYSALNQLIGLPHVHVEDAKEVAHSFSLVDGGMEFADALHLTSRPAGSTFVSFDKDLVKQANKLKVENVLEPKAALKRQSKSRRSAY